MNRRLNQITDALNYQNSILFFNLIDGLNKNLILEVLLNHLNEFYEELIVIDQFAMNYLNWFNTLCIYFIKNNFSVNEIDELNLNQKNITEIIINTFQYVKDLIFAVENFDISLLPNLDCIINQIPSLAELTEIFNIIEKKNMTKNNFTDFLLIFYYSPDDYEDLYSMQSFIFEKMKLYMDQESIANFFEQGVESITFR